MHAEAIMFYKMLNKFKLTYNLGALCVLFTR